MDTNETFIVTRLNDKPLNIVTTFVQCPHGQTLQTPENNQRAGLCCPQTPVNKVHGSYDLLANSVIAISYGCDFCSCTCTTVVVLWHDIIRFVTV